MKQFGLVCLLESCHKIHSAEEEMHSSCHLLGFACNMPHSGSITNKSNAMDAPQGAICCLRNSESIPIQLTTELNFNQNCNKQKISHKEAIFM